MLCNCCHVIVVGVLGVVVVAAMIVLVVIAGVVVNVAIVVIVVIALNVVIRFDYTLPCSICFTVHCLPMLHNIIVCVRGRVCVRVCVCGWQFL